MATTCGTIVQRAKAANVLNDSLGAVASEVLARIRAEQQEVFTRAAAVNRDFFQSAVSLASTTGGSGRIVDLTSLGVTPIYKPIERLLLATLADGTELNQVDAADVAAEYAPRFFVRGQSLVEVASDWGATGAVNLTLVYAYGMVDIDPAAGLEQPITLPDTWSDLLELPLAMYFHTRDDGRNPDELKELATQLGAWETLTGRRGAFLQHVMMTAGARFSRFQLPTPRQVGEE